MSTKCTIAYGDNFHFYRECADNKNVYLMIDSITTIIPVEIWETIKSYDSVTSIVPIIIPAEIWKTIKNYNAVTFKFKDYSKEKIKQLVESELKDFKETNEWYSDSTYFYFDKEKTDKENIKEGFLYYSSLRNKEIDIYKKINKNKKV